MTTKPVLTDDERKALLARGIEDPGWFVEFYFPRWFSTPLQWFHCGLLALLTHRVSWLVRLSDAEINLICKYFVWTEDPDDADSPKHPLFTRAEDGRIMMERRRYVLVMMPRGFGKTSVLNGAIVWMLANQCASFILLISKTAHHAEMQLDSIKQQLEANEKFRLVFGDLQPAQREGKWREDFIECRNGVRISAKGRGAQIRGMLADGERPDWVVVDDLEDRDTVTTAEQRAKTHQFVYSDLLPAMAEIGTESRLVATGTLLHAGSVLMTLRRDPNFATAVLEASYDDIPIWPSQWSMQKLDSRKRAYQIAGMLPQFYLEYHNRIRAGEGTPFRTDMIIYLPALPGLRTALALDPAISDDPESDFAAIAVVGIGDDGVLWVLDVWMERTASPTEQLEELFNLSAAYDCSAHGIESIAFQRSLVHTAQQWMFRKHRYFEITPILHGNVGKDERILGILQPRYAAGYMRHARRFPHYETQLLDFPNGKKDGPDAVAMAVSLLDPYAFVYRGGGAEIDVKMEPIEKIMVGWRRSI